MATAFAAQLLDTSDVKISKNHKKIAVTKIKILRRVSRDQRAQ